METVKTSDGVFPVASYTKIVGVVLVDLLIATVTLSFVVEFLKYLGFNLPEWFAAVFGVMAFLYAFLAYHDVVKSLGRWSHGVKRYTYGEVENYSGTGMLFVVEDLPGSVLSRRAIILALYFGCMILFMAVLDA
jgi:hypothetical protein